MLPKFNQLTRWRNPRQREIDWALRFALLNGQRWFGFYMLHMQKSLTEEDALNCHAWAIEDAFAVIALEALQV